MPRRQVSIREDLKGEIKRIAGQRCEYCKRLLLGENWEVEHIMPQSLGGTDILDNLAFACKRCNLNKRDNTHAIDRVTNLVVQLFNPRKDKWKDHFRLIDEQYVVGETAIGRATATLLFRTTSQRSQEDLRWWTVSSIKNESLYFYLNEQRARRLANQFTLLEKEFVRFHNYETFRLSTSRDQYQAKVAMKLIKIELCSMRSTKQDVQDGITLAQQLLRGKPPLQIRIELHHLLSILYQQAATIHALAGDLRESILCQKQAGNSYTSALSVRDNIEAHERLRQATVITKYFNSQPLFYGKEELDIAIEEALNGNLKAITYLADDELRLSKRSPHFDRVARTIEEALNRCGYGQDFDYARAIVLRRRWWAFKLLANDNYDLNLLASDIKYWKSKSIRMHNEVRELNLLIERIRQQHKIKVADDMLKIIQST